MFWKALIQQVSRFLTPHREPFITLDTIAALKHKTLQFALVFSCGAGQQSLGAYLLRRDLFPVIVLASNLLDEIY